MDAQGIPDPVRARGRPRSSIRDAEIREAAWALIARVGCQALTFEAVAQAVGCSRTTLYRRFASKGGLVQHLLDETALSFAPKFAIDAPPREKLLAHARTCVTIYTGDRGPAFIQIMAAARSDETIASAMRAHGNLVVPHYYEPLRSLAPGADERTIRFALHTLIGSILHHVGALGKVPNEQQLEGLVDVAIRLSRA